MQDEKDLGFDKFFSEWSIEGPMPVKVKSIHPSLPAHNKRIGRKRGHPLPYPGLGAGEGEATENPN